MSESYYRLAPPNHGFFPLFDEKRLVRGEETVCPANPEHVFGSYRQGPLYIILPSIKVPPMFWSWASECIITEPIVELLMRADVSGYRLERVIPTGVRRGDKDLSKVPPLFHLIVTGWGGMASPRSGLKLIEKCPACGFTRYADISNPGELIDSNLWDSSDLFFIWPLPRRIFITQRVADLLKRNRIRQFLLVAPSDMTFFHNRFSPGLLKDYVGEERANDLRMQIEMYKQQT